jgi:hypothetical protein
VPAYKGPDYTGAAFKLGAGVQGFEIMAAARDKGLVVVGGECPTVGIAGKVSARHCRLNFPDQMH